MFEAGKIGAHRIPELEQALFIELHDAGNRNDLGHGSDGKDGIVGHRNLLFKIGTAAVAFKEDFITAHNPGGISGDLAGRNKAVEGVLNKLHQEVSSLFLNGSGEHGIAEFLGKVCRKTTAFLSPGCILFGFALLPHDIRAMNRKQWCRGNTGSKKTHAEDRGW